VLLVTGMPRSGTSLACAILARLGVDFGPKLVGRDDFAPTGYFESGPVIRFEQWVVSRMGGDNVLLPANGKVPLKLAAEAHTFLEGRQAVKIPRAAAMLPLWEQALPHARWIVCLRHPEEVAASWKRVYRVEREDALEQWWRYYSRLQELDALWIEYAAWFEAPHWQLDRLAAYVGREPVHRALRIADPGHRHSCIKGTSGRADVDALYDRLERACSSSAAGGYESTS